MVDLKNKTDGLLLLEDTLKSLRQDAFSRQIFSCTASNNDNALCIKALSMVAGSADRKDVLLFLPIAVRYQDASQQIFSYMGSKNDDNDD